MHVYHVISYDIIVYYVILRNSEPNTSLLHTLNFVVSNYYDDDVSLNAQWAFAKTMFQTHHKVSFSNLVMVSHEPPDSKVYIAVEGRYDVSGYIRFLLLP